MSPTVNINLKVGQSSTPTYWNNKGQPKGHPTQLIANLYFKQFLKRLLIFIWTNQR